MYRLKLKNIPLKTPPEFISWRRLAGVSAFALLLCFQVVSAGAAEKLKIATAVRQSPVYYLPVLACVERGFCGRQGIEAEWVPFQSATSMYQAVAAGSVKIGLTHSGSQLPVAARGVPAVIVANLKPTDNFGIWVGTRANINTLSDLKGAKLGVSRFGGAEHAYGRLVARAVGLEQDVQFVSTGGIRESLAALRTAAIAGVILTPSQMIKLKEAGEVKELTTVDKYLPKPWMSYVIFAERAYIKDSPAALKKALRALLDSTRFIRSDASWTINKMKQEDGYHDKGAQWIYDTLDFSTDGVLGKEAVENTRRVFIEYGIISENTPRAEQLYTLDALP